MPDEIINKVAQSPLITIDLKEFYPQKEEYLTFDMADFLYEKLVLKEKNFRQSLRDINYSIYKDKYVGIFCSVDAIIPQWAYLLAAIHLKPHAKKVFYTDEKNLIQKILIDKIHAINIEPYKDKPIVIKGCSDVYISIEVYVELTNKLIDVAKSMMYGEPCSTVPLFKKQSTQ